MAKPFQTLISFLAAISACLAFGCNATKDYPDPHGLRSAKIDNQITPKLQKCAEDKACPDHADAIFWIAAVRLSEIGSVDLEFSPQDLGLRPDMTLNEIIAQLTPELEEHINELDSRPPNYNIEEERFIQAFNLLHLADQAGSSYAANEIGLIYMQNAELKNFSQSEYFFKRGLDKNDPAAAYNLARLSAIRAPNDKEIILEYLKVASELGQQDMTIAYNFALNKLGNSEEKRAALKRLKQINDPRLYSEKDFDNHFPNLASDHK